MGFGLVVRLDTLSPTLSPTSHWCSCGCVSGCGMLLGLWLPGIARVRLQCSVCLDFFVFFCICLAFRVGIQMLDPSISRADIEKRKNVEFSSHCHLAIFAGEEKEKISWFQQIREKNETWECT